MWSKLHNEPRLYNKETLMMKTELRARETFLNKIICSADPYEIHDS